MTKTWELAIAYGNKILFNKNGLKKSPEEDDILNHVRRMAKYAGKKDGFKNEGNYIVMVDGESVYLVNVFGDTMIFSEVSYTYTTYQVEKPE